MTMPPKRSLLRRLFAPAIGRRGGFARDEKGAVAIEFAVLALPFFALIFAILETSLVFFAGQILDSAVQDASRKIRTGQAQSMNVGTFRTEICKGLYGLFNCNEVKVRVRPINTFDDSDTSIAGGSVINSECQATGDPAKCNWTLTEEYSPGSGSSIILVEAYYKWPTMLNLPGFNLATQAGGTRLLAAVRVFSNEPF